MATAHVLASRLRSDLAQRRQEHRARRDLRRQLAAYTTQTEVDDLLAALHPHDGAEVELMRSILAEQAMRRRQQELPVALAS